MRQYIAVQWGGVLVYFRVLFILIPFVIIGITFQNCGQAFEAGDGQSRQISSISDGDQGNGPSEESNSQPDRIGKEESIPFLPQVDGASWWREWSDEFDGPQGSKAGAPWNYFDSYDRNPEKKWRDAYYTEDDAFLDGQSHLVMRAMVRNGRPETSYLRSTSDDSGLNFLAPPPTNLVLDPTKGSLYIEVSARFDKAFQSEDAWWAFWLFGSDTSSNGQKIPAFDFPGVPNLSAYDGNPQTGMEVDIFEYVPYLGPGEFNSRNGVNIAAFTSAESALHVPNLADTVFNGYIGDINNYLRNTGKDLNPNVQLTDGQFHTIGLYWAMDRYKFFIDGIEMWEITDPNFITRTRANSIVLSWEVSNGTWEGNANPEKTFVSENTNVEVLVDYVRVYRQAP